MTGVVVDDTNKNTDFKINGKWVLRGKGGGKFVQTRLGKLHNNVTQRVRPGGSYQRLNLTYDGVTIHPDFKDPQRFCDWVVNQRGWGIGYDLDKDLLGGRQYGPETCVFLPKQLNGLIRPGFTRSSLPGAYTSGDGKWWSVIGLGKSYYLGTYLSELLAHTAYVEFKELAVKLLAEKHKPTLEPKAFEALMVWEVPGKVTLH